LTTKYVTYRNVATVAAIVRMENLVKFGRAVLEICSLTDRQTDRPTHRETHTYRNTLLYQNGVITRQLLVYCYTVVKYASAVSEVVNNIYCYYYTVSSEMGLRGAM